MRKLIQAVRRLWAIGICSHRGAMLWPYNVDYGGDVGPIEILFCRGCGRMLTGCRVEDQPQHNTHWLEIDHMDMPKMRYVMWPQDARLRALAQRHSPADRANAGEG